MTASLRVMTFNLRTINTRDGSNNWPCRKELVVDLIRRWRPHFVGTQEGKDEVMEYLEQQLPTYTLVGCGREADRRGEHVGLFLDRETITVDYHHDFWLSDTPHIPGSRSWGNHCRRMVSCAVVRCGDRGPWMLLNTHFDHQSEPARVRSAALVREYVAAWGLPAVMTGDLNAEPSSAALMTLTKRDGAPAPPLIDTAVGGEPGATFHAFGKKTGERIDYILATPDFVPIDYTIIRDRPQGRWVSDHFPVQVTLQID